MNSKLKESNLLALSTNGAKSATKTTKLTYPKPTKDTLN